YDNITELIGNTPMVRLHRVPAKGGAEVVVKLEAFNPLSSVKDRIAISMIEDAEKRGEITPGKSVIVEATSGNTGIGLAFVAAAKGYRSILVMPDTMSVERRKLLQALGAELVLTPGSKGLGEALRLADEIAAKTPGGWRSKQFDNPANPKIHRETTAEEIWKDTGGKVDAVVAGVGTGGTVTGCGQTLKKRNPKIKVVAVMPVEAQVLKGGPYAPHKLQGIGPSFIPAIYDASVVDEVFDVTFDQAVDTSRKLAKQEGIFVGISSGAVAYAALETAKKMPAGSRVVAVLPDTGERYLSTPLFEYTELVNQPPTPPAPQPQIPVSASSRPTAP
ncbi:MAG TPA: cysteine synthase A, partial [Thermoanaerobaculia bacterium]|nr:cysteine synthase A [Thermoanaerobaculia bacterium]